MTRPTPASTTLNTSTAPLSNLFKLFDCFRAIGPVGGLLGGLFVCMVGGLFVCMVGGLFVCMVGGLFVCMVGGLFV